MTYNIRFDDKGNTQNSWINRKAAVADLIEQYQPNIFGVQEALQNQMTDLDHHFPQYQFIGIDRNNDGSGEFSAIFYDTKKVILHENGTFWLHPENKTDLAWDAACPRIATYGVFQEFNSNEKFLVVNTHFDHVGTVARKNSVDLIIDSLSAINTGNFPVILMGDFNMERQALPMVKLTSLFGDATHQLLADTIGTFNGFNHRKRPERVIDYILYDGDVKPTNAAIITLKNDDSFPSDHLPVFAKFQLNAFDRSSQSVGKLINDSWFFDNTIDDKHLDFPINPTWNPINLPHTWNNQDVLDDEKGYFRGRKWYRRTLGITLPSDDSQYHLHFEGANQVATIYVNGHKAGEHIGGYTSFTVNITPFLSTDSEQEVLVAVDNSHNPDIIPLEADFNFYGGIYRDVFLLKTPGIYFDRTYGNSNGIYYHTELRGQTGIVRADIHLENAGVITKIISAKQTIYGPDQRLVSTATESFLVHPGSSRQVSSRKIINNVLTWNLKTPELYRVVTTISDQEGNVLDVNDQHIGFRTIEFTHANGFVINGEKVKLIGTNRHQDYGGIGNALSNEQHVDDLLDLKDLGINFLRISHYPQDPIILQLADRLGFATTEEIPFVNEGTDSPAFRANGKSMLKEMIMRDFNHTSLFAWASSNELTLRLNSLFRDKTAEEKQAYIKFLAEYLEELHIDIKILDPDRYSYIVHCCGKERNKKIGMHSADIIGYNKYYGWYEGTFANIDTFIQEFDTLEPVKPFILSEYGAGADPRLHSLTPKRFDFSIEYQTDFHKAHLLSIIKNDLFQAVNVWNYADFMAEHRQDAVPHVNNKGLVDLYRKPKDAYYFYKAVLSEKPYVVIPSKMWTHRGGFKNGSKSCTQPISIFSNLDSVTLFINDKILGTKEVVDYEAIFDVPFKGGDQILRTTGTGTNKNVSDELEIHFDIIPDHFKEECPDTLRINVGSHCYFTDQKQIWFPDQPYRSGSYGHVEGKTYLRDGKELVGTSRNIIGTELDPIYQTVTYDMKAYRVDLPDGLYRVTFHLSDVIDNKDRLTIDNSQPSKTPYPFFNLNIEGVDLKPIPLRGSYIPYAITLDIPIDNGNGLELTFGTHHINFLNGLEIIRIQ